MFQALSLLALYFQCLAHCLVAWPLASYASIIVLLLVYITDTRSQLISKAQVFIFFDIRALWRSGLCARVPKYQNIEKHGLDQYGVERFGRLIFATIRKDCGTERVNELTGQQRERRVSTCRLSRISVQRWELPPNSTRWWRRERVQCGLGRHVEQHWSLQSSRHATWMSSTECSPAAAVSMTNIFSLSRWQTNDKIGQFSRRN